MLLASRGGLHLGTPCTSRRWPGRDARLRSPITRVVSARDRASPHTLRVSSSARQRSRRTRRSPSRWRCSLTRPAGSLCQRAGQRVRHVSRFPRRPPSEAGTAATATTAPTGAAAATPASAPSRQHRELLDRNPNLYLAPDVTALQGLAAAGSDRDVVTSDRDLSARRRGYESSPSHDRRVTRSRRSMRLPASIAASHAGVERGHHPEMPGAQVAACSIRNESVPREH